MSLLSWLLSKAQGSSDTTTTTPAAAAAATDRNANAELTETTRILTSNNNNNNHTITYYRYDSTNSDVEEQHQRPPANSQILDYFDDDNDNVDDNVCSKANHNDKECTIEVVVVSIEKSQQDQQLQQPLLPKASVWERYNEALETHPIVVKSLTGFIILGCGDLCGQGLERVFRGGGMDDDDYGVIGVGVDWPRACRFAAFGLMGAPWSHYYFYYLDSYLPPTIEPFTWTTLVKVMIDQGLQAPILLALMIAMLSLLKGAGGATSDTSGGSIPQALQLLLEGVRTDLSQNYWNSLVANWKLWLPASFVNLAFVKPTLRVLFVNAVFFVWTIILSMMING